MLKRKDLLGLKDISAEEIAEILETAAQMKKILDQNVKKTPHLQGKNVTTLFYENSTRTRVSFETAAKILGANTFSISSSTSSTQKGETLIDTGRNLDALLTDVIVLRSAHSGAARLLAKNVRAAVINAGDGTNEHPTQALLDIFTMQNRFGPLKGLKVVIAGDIRFSRVARSNIWGLNKLGASVTVVAPKTLLPADVAGMGCAASVDLDASMAGANVVMGLRVQNERQTSPPFPSVNEYAKYFGITAERLNLADPGALVMHPGPVNRGVELSGAAADEPNSVILEQVTNGVAVRMAVLFLLTRR
ncbi:MAG: aspartate carbamoyltransferase catalytic subunit [Clostridiales bacterium]|jgi:aspartate carbamoyltransferase catalytic subunit|nr:aspartate carbamoyltransferase catalytic subunit [Clostridiales bacterium]